MLQLASFLGSVCAMHINYTSCITTIWNLVKEYKVRTETGKGKAVVKSFFLSFPFGSVSDAVHLVVKTTLTSETVHPERETWPVHLYQER